MAFANLFTRLSAVDEDVKSPGQPGFTHRNQSENGKRSNARKRKRLGEHRGPYEKKPCYQEQKMDTYNTASFDPDNFKAIQCHSQDTNSEHASISFTKEVLHNHSKTASLDNMLHKGQNKNKHNVNKQQEQRRTTDGQKNVQQLRDKQKNNTRGGRQQARQGSRKGGGERKYKGGRWVKTPRLMTQEFKDQNVLLVDGRLLCRHFLWGRCIKGDGCQLEHIQGCNDLIKEVCKFYVQGFCTKQESCPYMHKSFPCKFFHRKGKCSQAADCRFSHEPLNEVTSRLLDEVLKRENYLYELKKKAEQDPSGQPASTDEAEITNTNTTFDMLIQPPRPNFYNSGETNAQHEALPSQAEEPSNAKEEVVLPQTQLHSSPSSEPVQEEPVCYSVEAVLGRQLFKPFPNFFSTAQSQDSASLPVTQTSSECTSGSVNQNEVPYSVDAFLRSCKSVENSSLDHTATTSAAQTVLYIPTTDCEKVNNALLRSEIQNKKAFSSVNATDETNKSQDKMLQGLSFHQIHTSGGHKKKGGEIPEPLKPAQRISHKAKLEYSPISVVEKSSKSKGAMKGRACLPADITCSLKSEIFPITPSKYKSPTCAAKPYTQLNPHVSCQTSEPQASIRPICPKDFSEVKLRAAVSLEPVTGTDKTNEIVQQSKKTKCDLGHGAQHYSNETTAECSSKMAHCGNLPVGGDGTQKRPFFSLFARPITDSLTPDSAPTPSSHQDFLQSSCPTLQSVRCTSKDKNAKTAAESDNASTRSFHGLFAAPLNAAPLAHSLSPPGDSRTASNTLDDISHCSDSKERTSELETPLRCQGKIDIQTSLRPSAPKLSISPKNEKNCLSKPLNEATEQQGNPTSVLPDCPSEVSSSPSPCGKNPDPCASTSHQQQSSMPSHKGTTAAATANSVLKTLFLCLSPYQQDGEQQHSTRGNVLSDSEKVKSGTVCVLKKQRKRKKKKMIKISTQHSVEKTLAHTTEHQPSLQTPQISMEAAGWSTLCCPAIPEPQMRNSGTCDSLFKAVTPPVQNRTQRCLKHTSEKRKWVNGNTSVTPLKDLFKNLDTTVFSFGD